MLIDGERKYMVNHDDKYIISSNEEDMDNVHVHVYTAETDVSDDHQHMFLGVTGPARVEGRSHVHQICTRTSFLAENSSGHWHWVDIMTDRAIAMPDGTHTHYFEGRTSMNDGHCHNFSDVTGLGPDICVDEDEEDKKPCKYKYKRPDDEEYN
ncbi:YmaF family protein [Pelosinus propionicus]|uniref:YmaF family protein n=1 Tax=Pelosinus propionicus DSM 13327 TaxID=1123291 RepID=A0A1I4PD29_9FIRM|nr:YmaF family protein [Pelosinus propionicus]SFM25600.1 YmaF family protein [Pelosinus propionicus DSM 13327]